MKKFTLIFLAIMLIAPGMLWGAAGDPVLSPIVNANIDAAAAIDASCLGDGSISTAEFNALDDMALTEMWIGGGAGLAAVATTVTGTGAPVLGTAPTFTTSITITGADADPDAAGNLRYDSTITGLSGGGLRWFDDDSVRLIVDLESDPSTDDYVVAYDADADGFYMKVDDGGNPGSFGSEVDQTLVSGVMDASGGGNWFDVDGEGDATDDLTEITALALGDIIILSCSTAAAYAVTAKDGTYLQLQADFIFDNLADTLTLMCITLDTNDTFREISRASNG